MVQNRPEYEAHVRRPAAARSGACSSARCCLHAEPQVTLWLANHAEHSIGKTTESRDQGEPATGGIDGLMPHAAVLGITSVLVAAAETNACSLAVPKTARAHSAANPHGCACKPHGLVLPAEVQVLLVAPQH